MRRRQFLAAAAGGLAGSGISGQPANALLAPTPPMGWMSWNQFGPEVSDQLLCEMADAMVVSGMKAAGYEYVCIDDLWHGGRTKEGYLFPDAQRFPRGIKPIADYLHNKGLKRSEERRVGKECR